MIAEITKFLPHAGPEMREKVCETLSELKEQVRQSAMVRAGCSQSSANMSTNGNPTYYSDNPAVDKRSYDKRIGR